LLWRRWHGGRNCDWKEMTTDNDDATEGAGSPPLEGWLYQCDISVWAAIDLMFVHSVTSRIQLEPATAEDIEAELDPPRVESSALTGRGDLLVIQAKLRRTGQWTERTLQLLAAHGKKRPSANARLADTRIRYVLVTSHGVNAGLRDLQVDDFLEQPNLKELPAAVFPKHLRKTAAKRFSILALHPPARVRERIKASLILSLRVPSGREEDCFKRLREEAIARMQDGSIWIRSEVLAIIQEFGGSDPNQKTSDFVKPDNWNDFVNAVAKRKAIVIAGPSGTGKTTLAAAISEQLSRETQGIELVDVVDGPATIRSRLRDPSPVLFHIEDPWGKYEVEKKGLDWSTEFSGLLHTATASRMYIVTTRSDVLSDSRGDWKFLDRWKVTLDADDYGVNGLPTIFDNGLASLPTGGLRLAALKARERALLELKTPFAITRFFHRLTEGPGEDDRSDEAFVRRVLANTQEDSIETEIKKLVDARGAVQWGLVLFAMLKVDPSFSPERLAAVKRAMKQEIKSWPAGHGDLLQVLIGGKNVRASGGRYIFSHPGVANGLQQAAKGQADDSQATLVDLIRSLVALGQDDSWAFEAAAKVRALSFEIFGQVEPLPPATQAAIDSWIDSVLGHKLHDYAAVLRMAAQIGSDSSIGAECARWLSIPDDEDRDYLSTNRWHAPDRSPQWYERMRSSPLTTPLLSHFIADVLGTTRRDYPRDIATDLESLSTELGDAWMVSAENIFGAPFDASSGAIGFGVMRAEKTREALLTRALASLPSPRYAVDDDADWASRDGHEDESLDYGNEDRDPIESLIEGYVAVIRAEDWRQLEAHPRLAELAPFWLREIEGTFWKFVSDEEARAVIEALWNGPKEVDAWFHFSSGPWRSSLRELMVRRLVGGPVDPADGASIANSTFSMANEIWLAAVRELIEGRRFGRLLDLFRELVTGQAMCDSDVDPVREVEVAAAGLASPFLELIQTVTPRVEHSNRLSDEALGIVRLGLSEASALTRAAVITHLVGTDFPVKDLARDIAFGTPEPRPGVVCVHLAAQQGWWQLVEEFAGHPRADVRQAAFEALQQAKIGNVSQRNTRFATDLGSRVRTAVVAAIEASPSPDDIDALLALIGDHWTDEQFQTEDSYYPIAQRAARALSLIDPLSPDAVANAFKVATKTPDRWLTVELLTSLANAGGTDVRRKLANKIAKQAGTPQEIAAIRALLFTKAQSVLEELDQVDDEWLRRLPAEIACTLACVLGRHATTQTIDRVATNLKGLAEHRVLLVPLAAGARHQSVDLARSVLKHLPPNHIARTFIDLDDDSEIPSEALADLGHIRIVEAIPKIVQGFGKFHKLTARQQADDE